MPKNRYDGYVPIPQARDIIKQLVPGLPRPSENIIRRAVEAEYVRAIRVGVGPRGRVLVNVDDVHALITEVPGKGAAKLIRELVDAAPEMTDEQITKIRLVLVSAGGDAA